MTLSRRTFLDFLAKFSVATVLPYAYSETPFADANSNIILGGGKFIDLRDPSHYQFALSVVNLALKQEKLVPLDFLAHGIIVDPKNHHRLLMFEKIGPGACEVDLSTMTKTRKISTRSDKYFYGHGAFSADANIVYSTETYLNTKKGIIAIRDADSMNYLGEFPTYGDNPHECQLIDNGKVMVVTNAGSSIGDNKTPCVAYIDIESQKLIETVPLTNDRLNTGHMGISRDGSLVVASAPRDGLKKSDLGGVSIRPKGKTMQSIATPNTVVNAMTGEALSVIIQNSKGIAAVTHPDGNMITFWSIANRGLIKAIKLNKPRGITLTADEQTFLVSYGADAHIMSIDVDTLSIQQDQLMQFSYLSGSHIYNWSKTLNEMLPLNSLS